MRDPAAPYVKPTVSAEDAVNRLIRLIQLSSGVTWSNSAAAAELAIIARIEAAEAAAERLAAERDMYRRGVEAAKAEIMERWGTFSDIETAIDKAMEPFE